MIHLVKISITALILFISLPSEVKAQTHLNLEINQEAEIFTKKKDYDVHKRLEEMQNLNGKEVTVYQISGKKHKIKNTYTGKLEFSRNNEMKEKDQATVLTVVQENELGIRTAHFPLTNSKNVRIYLTAQLK